MGIVAAAEFAVQELHKERDLRDEPRIAAKRVLTAWPCDTYHRRGEISGEQHTAAQRLHASWLSAGLNPWAANGDGVPNHGEVHTPGQGPTYAAYVKAVRAVGCVLFPVLAEVVIVGRHAGAWVNCKRIDAGRNAVPPREAQREGMITLKLALDALVAHYRGARK